MTTSTDITATAKITLLKHLASGKGLDVVATIVGLPRDQVLDIASHHGYPDREKLGWAVDVLEKKLTDDAALPVRAPERAPSPIRPAAGASTPPAAGPATTPLTQPDEIRVLLNTAKGHESKRIQNAANKVIDDLDRLRALIRDDQEKHAERRKAEAAKAAARAEVDRLEAQLAEAKAKLRGPATTKSAPADGVSAAEVRAWAAQHDVDCPAVGRVPNAVREAYDDAHPAAKAS